MGNYKEYSMENQFKTTEQIQAEIDRLRKSPYVKIAKKAENDMLARHKIFRTKHSILQKARKNTVQCMTF